MAQPNGNILPNYQIQSKPYKQGFINSYPDGVIRATCCGVNSPDLISNRAAKLWITRTWNSFDLDGSTIEVIF